MMYNMFCMDISEKTVDCFIFIGMLHVGLGETQLSNLLASVNLHYLSVSGLKTREEEVGAALDSYAEESMIKYLNIESNLQENTHDSDDNGENKGIAVSTDTCWQKKGSGKSYNSLSGCASLIGQKTGKVLNVKIKSKNCRTCDVAKRKGIVPKEHKCSKNHTGSSKGMEPALVVDMIKDVINKGVDIKEIAGDDDTTGFQRAQNVLKIKLKKRSDKNHIKKNISKQLYAIKKNYKELSQRVINYIMQNFSYMVAQNKKNTEGVTTGLKAMVGHIFGDHSFCNTKWCVFLEHPLAKFSKLPYGKPLQNPELRKELDRIFIKKLSIQAEKLANLASTQTNENLNQMLATKAPKYKHYSASNSLSYRFSATVAQKNEGHRYVHEVHESMGLSPGNFTIKRATFMDKIRRKYSKLQKTRKYKRRRIELKSEKCNSNGIAEVLEGTTYETNIDIEDDITDQLEEIPTWKQITAEENFPIIVFDLETTGLSRQSDIVQIAALTENETFSAYVMPSKKITPQASDITKLAFFDGQMYYDEVPVESSPPFEVFTNLIAFLSKFPSKPTLVGHNIKTFDCHILYNQLNKLKMWDEFCLYFNGFIDTRILFRSEYPGRQSYKQCDLVSDFLGESYDAHNALYDCKSLFKLVRSHGNLASHFCKYTFDGMYPKYCQNDLSFKALVENKVMSKQLAKKAASTGLCKKHFILSIQRNGIDGLRALLSQKNSSGVVRVTTSKSIIQKVYDFFVI
ncbi:uncharacterized protein LOC127711130 isoform X2 [Mytilus californianus]|uniref:uncharacterized protein LOC127711130 isoform X2 n=1 Tax=Mytilus californianus TaxID=6549 RepID=UPI002245E851|nr:uncharacterized protein LOC127711130 isoform X2 [Mytilus californianus]